MTNAQDQPTAKQRLTLAMTALRSDFEELNTMDANLAIILGFAMASVAEILGFLLLAKADSVPLPSSGRIWLVIGLALACVTTIIGFIGLMRRLFARGPLIDQLRYEPTTWNDLIEVVKSSANINKLQRRKTSLFLKATAFFAMGSLISYTVSAFLFIENLNPPKSSSANQERQSGVKSKPVPKPASQNADKIKNGDGSTAGPELLKTPVSR
jgi:hypothetical protein